MSTVATAPDWPLCPRCGRMPDKQHGDGCWVCPKGHGFRTDGGTCQESTTEASGG